MAEKVVVKKTLEKKERRIYGEILQKKWGVTCSLSVSRFGRQTLKVLSRMTRENIPALPVHDSVICQARHEGFLRQVMVEEYQKVMGFEPVIG